MLFHLFINLNPSKIYDFSDVQQHIQQKKGNFFHTQKTLKYYYVFLIFPKKPQKKWENWKNMYMKKYYHFYFVSFFRAEAFRDSQPGLAMVLRVI